MTFDDIIKKYREAATSNEDLGTRFEVLMREYLLTDPLYCDLFTEVWLWNDFFGKNEFGGHDTGIDLVGKTTDSEFWAIQCKCYASDHYIDKPAVDTFLSTSGKTFTDQNGNKVSFVQRLWLSTTNRWTSNAEEAIKNQHPPVNKRNLHDLKNAPVDWDKIYKGIHGEPARAPKKEPFLHQQKAINDTLTYFETHERGKLIMACGTGKTFTSLRIAEGLTQGKGTILFLVPSIALLGQTLNEWFADAQKPINAICICSDPQISRKRNNDDDTDSFSTVDLALPASTNIENIMWQYKHMRQKEGMTVVFSTYQSIEVIAEVSKMMRVDGQNPLSLEGKGELLATPATGAWVEDSGNSGVPKEPPMPPSRVYSGSTPNPGRERGFSFDLIICDEAHRTTGVTLTKGDESAFVKVHDNSFISAHKRLYMTATPRIYSADAKSKAAQSDAALCSMDDPLMYGEEVYRIGFGEAVSHNLLSDYKVLILALNEQDVPPTIQDMLAGDADIDIDDIPKLIGCINALSKQIIGDGGSVRAADPALMKKAVAFCRTIKISKKIKDTLNTITGIYLNSQPPEIEGNMVRVIADHIDGTMGAGNRQTLMSWLKEETNGTE